MSLSYSNLRYLSIEFVVDVRGIQLSKSIFILAASHPELSNSVSMDINWKSQYTITQQTIYTIKNHLQYIHIKNIRKNSMLN